MDSVINGIYVSKEGDSITFTYRGVPVSVTVHQNISYDDVVDIVVYQCMEIDADKDKIT